MTVGIHYTGNATGLAVLLTNLQPQLSPSDDIYIVDSTPNRSGVDIAKLYGTTRCYIFVEVGKYSASEARDFTIQSAIENKQEGVLMISDCCIVAETFVINLKKSAQFGYRTISPKVVVLPYPQMDSNFQWYNPPTRKVISQLTFQSECYYLNLVDDCTEHFGAFPNETVVVLPYTK